MDIKYFGHSSFFIKSKECRIVTDPFDPSYVPLKFPKTEADVVTISHGHPDHKHLGQIAGDPLILDWAGEYEKLGVGIKGYQTYHDKKKGAERGENVMYKFSVEGIDILHCGDLGHTLSDKEIEEIGNVDILMVPVGGHFTIDATEAVDVIKEIDPHIVIPMHYGGSHMSKEPFDKLGTLENFIKKIGASPDAPLPKLTLKKEDIGEEMKVVILQIGG